jgi:hypothetical protein
MAHTRHTPSIRPRLPLVAATLLLASGCTQLPDVTPFATATADMAAAVRTAGPAVASEVERMEHGQAAAKTLSQSWAARDAAMAAVVSYSDSLVSIVNAAHDKGEAVGKLAEKLGGLATAAGLPLPGASAALGVVTDAAKFVWAQIELARGAASLEEALAAAQPAIDRIADKLGDDFKDLDVALRAAVEGQRGAIEADPTYNIGVGTRDTIVESKLHLLERLAQRAGNDRDGLTDDDIAALGRIDALAESTSAVLEDPEKRLDELGTRAGATTDLLHASADAVQRWSIAHRDLVNAVANRRGVDVDSLTSAAVEIRDLVKRVREL